ncbi:Uu.00g073210.m01.CDS01 [Anthostomella pinea]|uniref:Uu.00g073210.m01.CDS01 n=1 Tax=Anthostomella pinea TaxID=933095 RepID=A0AAI8VPL7_9PEZI|nr:Uu.00g073210.m01.CDS01 [Anthostomella pinea]
MVDQKFCHAFQVGACTRGEACRYAHKLDPNFKRKACAHFAKNKCNRGKDCKFSHAKEDIDLLKATSGASVPGGTSAGASGSVSTATTEAQFKQWRYNIPIPDASRGKTRPLGGPAMSNFCKQALALVSGEAGLMQEVISLLASEGGSQRLTEVVDQGFEGLNEAQTAHIFDAQILPFFQAISHKNVLASVIMNGRVMTIYNIIYGGDGQRVVSLFAAVTRHLQSLQLLDAENSQVANLQSVLAIETSLAVLHKLIEVNTEAQVHDGLKLVGETFSTILEEPLPETAAFAFKPAQKCLRRIEQRLGLGQALPESKDYVKTVGHRATFELARELPGELSEDGPRHDNDNVDIRRISILPTVQEIQSSRTEYLPPADPRKWHIGGLRGLLDRHFRLLREDTVGQLRDAAKFELERLQNPRPQDGNNRREHQGARTFVYENVTLSDLAFDAYGGMEFVLSFDQPKDLHSKSEDEHREWWQSSKRLGYEALICLLSSEGSVTFFVVSRVPMKKKKKDDEDTDTVQLHKQYNLWSNQERANVIAKPVEQSDVHALLDKLLHSNTEQYSLVEFPGILLPAFRPTLQAMQRLSDSLDVPFPEILAPISTPANPSREAAIDLPAYAMKPGFRFNLSGVTEPGFNLHLTPAQNMDAMAEELAIYSTLDPGQAQAVVSSLSRSLALIQGPPGTGKSYTGVQLIKILLDNRAAGELGPLICVCYTNHALDQGLERLVDEGVKHVVRIGGSSKSERLAEVNLRAVTQRLDLTKTEKGDRWSLWKNIEAEAEEINRILSQIRQLGAEDAVAAHLEMHNPKHYENLFGGEDEDGWQISGRHRGSVLDSWLKSAAWGQGRPRSVDVLQDVHVGNMTGFERRILHQSWLDNIQEDLQDMLRRALSEYNRVKQQHDLISTELDLRVLRQANIIGITTSGLAKNLDLIRRTGAKVLVCEEAGEVLESHLLTALLPTVEHAILIGDHQQLRPHIQNHDLSSESKSGLQYSFDVSLFERLVQPRDILAQPLPYCTLSVQRRMHPSISQLVRKTLYPQLEDAPSVMSYPNVVGMRQRLFWMHHEHKENGAEGAISMSHTNDFEVGMVASLVTHLVHQGIYASDEIAVITLYLGQLRKIRNKLGSTFNIVLNERDVEDLQKQADTDPDDGELVIEKLTRPSSIARGTLLQALRVATVDNFQGEEAKVIIISLVRSNAKNNPGFLKTSNRINVLLSRAKHGMYIIGNSNTTSNVEMWSAVLDIFRGDGNFGNALELCCPRHEATPLSVNATFCQNCATGNIKSMTVDFIMFETYADINLDDNPCIFTACGHIFTIGSMDGIMDMPKHYVIDTETDKPRALKTSSEPFSSGELKVCPACRSSLRSVARYGRIVRRALLDESAKKLTAWSNSTHATLEERLAQDQEKLLVSLDRSRKPGQDLKLLGQVSEQVKAVKRLSTVSRYQKIIATRNKIQAFAKKLGKDEQPYQRVRNLVETVRRQHQDSSMAEFDFSSAELQLREHLQATSLLVRCEIILLSDVVSMHDKTPAGRMKGTLQIDFTANRTRCDLLVKEAQSTQNFRQAVEGDIFWARFAAMECGNIDATAEGAQPGALHVQEVLNKAGFDRLDSADKVCKSFVGKDVNPTKGLKDEIVDVRRMLNKGVSTSEMKMVVAAMAREFSGTGHWYRCVNGHPFTVGECGMPMQLARCPACGAGIGGQNHQATAGVEHARDIEEDFGNMHL